MKFLRSVAVLALSATLASAQDNTQNATYLSGLVQALNTKGLTTLASTLALVNATGTGNQLLATLSNRNNNYTVFAPSNQALSDVSQDIASLTNIIAYHVVFGHFPNVTDYPNTTIGRTALGDPAVVMLEGQKNQVVAWARRGDGQVHILNQNSTNDPTIDNQTTYENLNIYVVDGILEYPSPINQTFEANANLTGFADLAQETDVAIWNTGSSSYENASISEVLYGVRGLTFFVPSNQASTQGLPGIDNTTELYTILRNHIINGTTVYSPALINATYVSAAGQYLHFATNSSGKFVTSGNVTAQIIQPDILTKNGVFHIIDRVLLNDQVNEEAAGDAFESHTELSGHSSTETGPVGVPTGGSNGGIDGGDGALASFSGVNAFTITLLSVAVGSTFLFA